MQRVVAVVLALTAAAVAAPVPKPSAPIEVTLDARAVAGGYVVTLAAVPTRAVPAVELTVAGKTVTFGPTAAGQRREFAARVAVPAGAGLDVVGSAVAAGRNKAAVLHVGAVRRQAPRRSVTRTLPDGREIDEVR